MQPLDTKRYLRPALASLLGVGCVLLILLEGRRYNHHIRSAESKSIEPSRIGPGKTEFESVSLANRPTNLNGYAGTVSRLARQRNTLFAVTGVLLIVSIALGSILVMQIHPSWVTGFNTKPNLQLTQIVTANTERVFERGLIFPRFTSTAYGQSDTVWHQGIQEMKAQTNAQWIEIPILFSQATGKDTHVELSKSSPDVATFVQGVQKAHTLGYKVFFTPLMTVRIPGGWSGDIDVSAPQDQQAWFDSYWNALKPYAQAAQDNKVEQMAVATELQVLQKKVPAPLWNQLFTRVASIFTSTRTYDMNWSSLALPMPSWLGNPLLNMIGVSSYIPLTNVNQPIPTEQIPLLWQQKIKTPLDKLSTQFGKRVLITELGYRNTSDALYQTWIPISSAPPDPQLQAQAYNAALLNIFPDPHIAGVFFWGWDNVDQFAIKGQPAVQVLQNWYSRSI